MASEENVPLQFAKVVVVPVLWLFFIPAVTIGFLAIALPKVRFSASAEQFYQVQDVAWGAIYIGVGAMLGAAVLGGIAFLNRNAQAASFAFGWRMLTFLAGVEVVLQGGLMVWLSYWLPAYFFEVWSVKLVVIAGVLALFAVLTVLKGLFKKLPEDPTLEAEIVTAGDAPMLWTRLRELAQRMRTEPPKHVVAGIDDNFFVIENGVRLANGKLEGRTLYVSLPLLRMLTPTEADAVFAHEIAHLKGGDTAVSAQLGPELVRYNIYIAELAAGGATKPVYYLLRLFSVIFELAMSHERRARELIADKEASRVTSAEDVGRSLIKTTAYSSFRIATEQELFAHEGRHVTSLGLKDRIDKGLSAHVSTPHFAQTLKTLRTPHPFDSHPPLEERLKNVNAQVRFEGASELLTAPRGRTWVDDIGTAAAIEERLWETYEGRFRAQHDQSLAYRYKPSNDEERALVERFFPPCNFANGDYAVDVTYDGLVIPECDVRLLPFAWIQSAKVEDGTFKNGLIIEYRNDRGQALNATIKLRKLGKQAEALKAVFSHYWTRDQAARAHVSSNSA